VGNVVGRKCGEIDPERVDPDDKGSVLLVVSFDKGVWPDRSGLAASKMEKSALRSELLIVNG
jgi:hypothetical protein